MTGAKKKPSNLFLRFAIGIPLGAVVVCLFAFGNRSLLVFIIIVAWLALRELWRIAGVDHPESKFPLSRLGEIAAIILLFTAWSFPTGSLVVMIALMLPVFLIFQLVARARGAGSFLREVAVVTLGVLYIAGLLSFIFKLRYLQFDLETIEAIKFSNGIFNLDGMTHITLFPVLTSWCCDTAALLSGKFFGRAKLAPGISPKKTIGGLIGGVAGSVTGVIVYAWLIGLIGQVEIYELIAFGAIAAALSQLGDLTVSAIKREADMKDTGTLLGAHGGILDRIDGFLFALPATYIFFLLVLM